MTLLPVLLVPSLLLLLPHAPTFPLALAPCAALGLVTYPMLLLLLPLLLLVLVLLQVLLLLTLLQPLLLSLLTATM